MFGYLNPYTKPMEEEPDAPGTYTPTGGGTITTSNPLTTGWEYGGTGGTPGAVGTTNPTAGTTAGSEVLGPQPTTTYTTPTTSEPPLPTFDPADTPPDSPPGADGKKINPIAPIPEGGYEPPAARPPETVTLDSSGPGTGHFANWDQWFNANAESIAQRGQDVLTKVGQDHDKAKDKVDALGTEFQTQADEGLPVDLQGDVTVVPDGESTDATYAPTDRASPQDDGRTLQTSKQGLEVDNSAYTPGGESASGTGTSQQGLTDPTRSSSAGEKMTVSGARELAASSAYNGPSSLADLQDYLDTQTSVMTAGQQVRALGATAPDAEGHDTAQGLGGLEALLDQMYGGNANMMDAALIGGGNRPAFDEKAKTWNDLDAYLKQGNDRATSYGQGQVEKAGAVAKKLQELSDNPDMTETNKNIDAAHKKQIDESLMKPEDFDKFNTVGATSYITDILSGMNPLSGINMMINGQGARTMESGLHDRDGSLMSAGGTSQRYLKGLQMLQLQGYSPDEIKQAYNYMTAAEVQKVKSMDGREAEAYFKAKVDQIRKGWSPYNDPNWGKV